MKKAQGSCLRMLSEMNVAIHESSLAISGGKFDWKAMKRAGPGSMMGTAAILSAKSGGALTYTKIYSGEIVHGFFPEFPLL